MHCSAISQTQRPILARAPGVRLGGDVPAAAAAPAAAALPQLHRPPAGPRTAPSAVRERRKPCGWWDGRSTPSPHQTVPDSPDVAAAATHRPTAQTTRGSPPGRTSAASGSGTSEGRAVAARDGASVAKSHVTPTPIGLSPNLGRCSLGPCCLTCHVGMFILGPLGGCPLGWHWLVYQLTTSGGGGIIGFPSCPGFNFYELQFLS